VAIAYILGSMPFLAQPMLSAIVYLWSREYADQVVSIFGLFNVQAFYFPWVSLHVLACYRVKLLSITRVPQRARSQVLLAMRVLMGQSPVDDLVGIFSGHVFYFAEDVQGLRMKAPTFLRDLLDGPAPTPEARNRNMFGGHHWGGGGQRLGG